MSSSEKRRRFLQAALLGAVAFAFCSLACSLAYDVHDLEGPAGDAGPSSADGGALGDCPGDHGPRGVRVRFDGGTFCIDSTEVTKSQYAAFLTAKGSDTSGQPATCASNTTYTPTDSWPMQVGEENDPVVYVDWCDARAFCAWAGKRLCGSRVDQFVTRDEWYVACSRDGTRAYPYGNDYEPNACNGNGRIGKPIAVATSPRCVGGYDGLFDMSGNASEWVDSCSGSTCSHRGGGFYSNNPSKPGLACADVGGIGRFETFSTVGIRCCVD